MVDIDPNLATKAVEAVGLAVATKDTLARVVGPSADEVGKLLARAVSVALVPANAALRGWEILYEEAAKLLAPPSNGSTAPEVIAPPLHVAGPLMLAYPFAQDDPALRTLFAHLLATSMRVDSRNRAHPAFVDVIRQLSPSDARIVAGLATMQSRNSVACLLKTGSNDGVYEIVGLATNLPGDLPSPKEMLMCFDNLSRLGIARRSDGYILNSGDAYEGIMKRPDVLAIGHDVSSRGRTCEGVRISIEISDFGEAFIGACT